MHKKKIKDMPLIPKNAVKFDSNWKIRLSDEFAVKNALDDLKDFFENGLDVTLNENGTNIFYAEKGDFYGIKATDNSVCFSGRNIWEIVQSVFYFEDLLAEIGAPYIEKKNYPIKETNRYCTFVYAEDSKEYLTEILRNGYKGVIFLSDDTENIKLANSLGLITYADSEESFGYYFEETPDDEMLKKAQEKETVFSCIYWNSEDKKSIIEKLPKNSILLSSFEQGQVLVRENASVLAQNGAIAAAEPSDELKEDIKLAKDNGIRVLVQNHACGRTNEFGTVPYIPAMLQWTIRHKACTELDCFGFVESDYYGFVPSIVSEFTKKCYLSDYECGVIVQKLAGEHFGYENSEKAVMAFKKISDGANCILAELADINGPLTFGPAYPLVLDEIYDFPFDEKDITLQIDALIVSADNFNKASGIISKIDNIEASELAKMCKFISNVLVTNANTKRWYRRLHYANREKLNFKKKFLFEQMVDIGNKENKNAEETGNILFDVPFLAGNGDICSADKIEAKMKLTNNAVSKLKLEIEKL